MRVYGLADRAHGVPFTADTRVAIASGAKGFTALTVMRLVEERCAHTSAPEVRELLGDDLPLIDDAVTIEQLLAHRSGIGDYLDEGDGRLDLDAHLLACPGARSWTSAESYLAVIDGFPQAFEPDDRHRLLPRRGLTCCAARERAARRRRSTSWSSVRSSTGPA